MKLFPLLASIYLLLLALVPCTEQVEACRIDAGPKTEVIVQTVAHSHGDPLKQERHVDLCSPICTCACCGVNLPQPADPIVPAEVQHPFNATQPLYRDNWWPLPYTHTIWQPPRLG